jgi:hypothetical protein
MWVGFDGWYKSQTVEQDGVSAHCNKVGATAKYYLWYELFKGDNINPWANIFSVTVAQDLGDKLQPGDAVDMFVSIIQPDRLGGIPLGRDSVFFSLSAYDPSGRRVGNWTKTVKEPLGFSPAYSSRECVAETPGLKTGLSPLLSFDSVRFQNCSAIDSAEPNSLQKVNIVRANGHVLATTEEYTRSPSGLNQFVVHWVAAN